MGCILRQNSSRAVISFVRGLLFEGRILPLFFLLGFVIHGEINWAVSFIGSCILYYIIVFFGEVHRAKLVYQDVLTLEERRNHSNSVSKWNLIRLNSINLEMLLNKQGVNEIKSQRNSIKLLIINFIARKAFKIQRSAPEIPIVFLLNKSEGKFIEPSFYAYTNPYGLSYIVLNTSLENLNYIQKFLLRHEVAHATGKNIGLHARKYYLKIEFFWTTIVLFIVIGFNLFVLLPVLFVSLSFLHTEMARSEGLVEAHADLWAMHQEHDLQALYKIEESYSTIWNPENYGQLHTLFQDRNNITDDGYVGNLASYLIYGIRKKAIEKYIRNRQNENINLDKRLKFYIKPTFATFLLIATLIYASYSISAPSFVWMMCSIPIAGYFLYNEISLVILTEGIAKNYWEKDWMG